MFDVSPRGPYSRATTEDKLSTPALAAQPWARRAVPWYWSVALMKIILPPVPVVGAGNDSKDQQASGRFPIDCVHCLEWLGDQTYSRYH